MSCSSTSKFFSLRVAPSQRANSSQEAHKNPFTFFRLRARGGHLFEKGPLLGLIHYLIKFTVQLFIYFLFIYLFIFQLVCRRIIFTEEFVHFQKSNSTIFA